MRYPDIDLAVFCCTWDTFEKVENGFMDESAKGEKEGGIQIHDLKSFILQPFALEAETKILY